MQTVVRLEGTVSQRTEALHSSDDSDESLDDESSVEPCKLWYKSINADRSGGAVEVETPPTLEDEPMQTRSTAAVN